MVDDSTELGGRRLLICIADVLVAQRCNVGIAKISQRQLLTEGIQRGQMDAIVDHRGTSCPDPNGSDSGPSWDRDLAGLEHTDRDVSMPLSAPVPHPPSDGQRDEAWSGPAGLRTPTTFPRAHARTREAVTQPGYPPPRDDHGDGTWPGRASIGGNVWLSGDIRG